MLVADIGGTNARFALAREEGGRLVVSEEKNFRAVDFDTPAAAAAAYFETVGEKPAHACFAIAAPIRDDEAVFTNSPWRLRRDETKKNLSLQSLHLINDFYALAAGVRHLSADAFISVRKAPGAPEAPVLVIGPGTGLGQALIVPAGSPEEGAQEKIVSTEGGHVSFAPATQEEFAVMQFIARDHGRVSVERLLSGGGLETIYAALCAPGEGPLKTMAADAITKAALAETDPVAHRTVMMFCAILGRVAGDAVLATGARGGVVLGGGILPKITDLFLQSGFVESFLDKGRMQSYVETAPVRLMVKEGGALYGAAASLKEALDAH